MTPKYVVYECEEDCGKLFYREVESVITDDGAECHVNVKLVEDANGEIEEFPMCSCLGGNAAYGINLDDCEEETPIAE